MLLAHKKITLALVLAVSCAAAGQNASGPEENPATGIVEGSVLNAQNSRAIPRATVNLVGLQGAGRHSVRADGSGHFTFTNVEPGAYKLMAERQGFFSDGRRREYEPQFDVGAGQHVKNIAVRLIPTSVISGEIVDEYNDALQNVEVRVLATRMNLGRPYLIVDGIGTTDDRGQYRIAGLHPGKYYVVAEYKQKQPAESGAEQPVQELAPTGTARPAESPQAKSDPPFTYPPLFYPGSGDFQQAQSLRLNPGDETPVNFIFISSPVVAIKGRVTNGMTGEPATTATVSAYWTDYVEGAGVPAKVSRLDGTFEIRGMAPGLYTLRASYAVGKETYFAEQTVEVGHRGAENIEIALLPDFTVQGHVTVSGETDPSGRIVPVEFVGEGMLPRVRGTARPPEFKFDANLRQGRSYHVIARNLHEDEYLKSVQVAGHEVSRDSLVVNGLRGNVELVVSPAGGRIEGTLFDQHDQPTRGSVLLIPDLYDPGPSELFRRTSADGRGKFTFRGVAPGSYRLLALESLTLYEQLNEPDFSRRVAGKGDLVSVEESGRYAVHIRLSDEP